MPTFRIFGRVLNTFSLKIWLWSMVCNSY